MTGGPVAAAPVNLLENGDGGSDREAGTTVLFGDQAGEIAGFGQGRNEGFGVRAVTVQYLPVGTRKAGAELSDAVADIGPRVPVRRGVRDACRRKISCRPGPAADGAGQKPTLTPMVQVLSR